jgi:hypothetical protein
VVWQGSAGDRRPYADLTGKQETNPLQSKQQNMIAAASGFEENLDNAVNHFKLLRIALGEKRINSLPDVSWVFFPFQKQENAGRQRKTSGHRDYRVQAWHLIAAFYISPEVSGNIPPLSSIFEAEFRRLSEFSDPLRK